MAPRTSHLTARQQRKFNKVMREFKHHQLHAGSKKGPLVKKRGQALAIAFSEANAIREAARRYRK